MQHETGMARFAAAKLESFASLALQQARLPVQDAALVARCLVEAGRVVWGHRL